MKRLAKRTGAVRFAWTSVVGVNHRRSSAILCGTLAVLLAGGAARVLADCPGDADGSGFVDNGDLDLLLSGWERRAGEAEFEAGADFDGNGVLNNGDLDIVLNNWNENCALSANFTVKKLVRVELNDPGDPSDDQEFWEEAGLSPDDPIDLGLQVKFDSTACTGPVEYYSWYFGDGASAESDPLHGFSSGGEFDVRLTVYDAPLSQAATITKTVYVAEGMRVRSVMPHTTDFRPILATTHGSEVWAISQLGKLGVADLSNPDSLPGMEIIPSAVVSSANAMSASGGKLAVSRGTSGVSIFCANRSNFALLSTITASSLGAAGSNAVAANGNYLFVGTAMPGSIAVYDLSGSQPARLYAVACESNVYSLGMVAGGGLAARVGSSSLLLFDARNASSGLDLAAEVELTLGSGQVEARADRVSVRESGGIVTLPVTVPSNPSDSIAVGEATKIPTTASYFAVEAEHAYYRTSTSVDKHNHIDPRRTYRMDGISTNTGNAGDPFLFDPDGAGPQPEVLFVPIDTLGFMSVEP